MPHAAPRSEPNSLPPTCHFRPAPFRGCVEHEESLLLLFAPWQNALIRPELTPDTGSRRGKNQNVTDPTAVRATVEAARNEDVN